MERFFGTVKDKLDRFGSMDRLMEWYNTVGPHMSLNLEVIETPYGIHQEDARGRDGRGRGSGGGVPCPEEVGSGELISGSYTAFWMIVSPCSPLQP